MNTISVFINGEEFCCTQKFDVDNNIDSIDIYTENDQYIGNISGLIIPFMYDEDFDTLMENFNNQIESFLEEVYY
jgi:hypothetical protein